MTSPSRLKCGHFFALLFGVFVHSFAPAADAVEELQPAQVAPIEAAQTEVKQEEPLVFSTPHANIFALSFAYQAPLSFEKSPPLGGGITYTHEYFVTRRTALGVHVGVRFFQRLLGSWRSVMDSLSSTT